MQDIIVKTLCSIQPSLSHYYRSSQPEDITNSMCFELLGFDIMLDSNLKPWLIEVNHAPSFATDSPLDKKLKKNVLRETFILLNIGYRKRVKYYARGNRGRLRASSGRNFRDNIMER
mmetsp:Transcript_28381/g.5157  ORF Transcript_28381/g.5157 Transcript_28381/m.5157 type:complete len:117 (+) Transcript_28381:831-1181(+)